MNELFRVEETQAKAPLPAFLIERASDYMREAKSERTRKVYATAWKMFTAWCDQHDRCPLPCS
jgi:hypothetical protein